MSPLVSVVIPVFNRETLVKGAIDSVLKQTYQNIEIIVIDDGSTDNTYTVLRQYEEQYPDKFRVIRQQNTGQVVAKNNGIQKSSGELIAFLDSDDLWLPDKLEKQVPLFTNNVGLVYCGINEIDDKGNFIRTVSCESGMRGQIYHKLLVRNRMTGGTVVVSRSAIDKVGLFDPQLMAAENWDLWIRISKDYLVDYVDEPLMNYRKHAGNMSSDNQFMAAATKNILQKHFPVVPADPILRRVYDEAYINYYFNLSLYFFGQSQYKESRLALNCIKKHGTFNTEMRILMFRTFLGKFINRYITTTKSLTRSLLFDKITKIQ